MGASLTGPPALQPVEGKGAPGPHLVQRRHEARVVVEGRHDQGVVLLMHVQDGLDVHLGVLKETGDSRQSLGPRNGVSTSQH